MLCGFQMSVQLLVPQFGASLKGKFTKSFLICLEKCPGLRSVPTGIDFITTN